MSLSRASFIKILTESIITTREKVAVNNQLSGYEKFQYDIKENDYFNRVREELANTAKDEHLYRYKLIKHIGLGNCQELAEFLAVRIAKLIDRQRSYARIRIVASKEVDHVYLEILIRLQNEVETLWEVDAWDPRIIDISTRPDGTIKNLSYLDYGFKVNFSNTIYTDQINYNEKFSFYGIRKPKPGRPRYDATPRQEMLEKHQDLYEDYTLTEVKETFDINGEIKYPQQVSGWQRLH